jgi:type VI secretion system protein ImpE
MRPRADRRIFGQGNNVKDDESMNEAKARLDSGNLHGAVQSAINLVKAKPTDVSARTFLFELSLFTGDWDRASRQLDAIGHTDPATMIGSLIYRQNIEAEKKRQRLFSDGLKPEFLADAPDYVYGLLHAANRLREGNTGEAREILDKVEEDRPAITCKINGIYATDFRDYNDLTMCVLEALIKDTYVWIPFEHIVRLDFEKPKTLRDLFWMQAKVETINGTGGDIFVPALYANSYKNNNPDAQLGRMTDWRAAGDEIFVGEGLRMFWLDGEERAILELEEIEFDSLAETSDSVS